MNFPTVDADDALAAPFYLFGVLLIATPLMDFVTSVLPLQPSNIQWRFASVGLLSGFLLTPLLGVALCVTVAAIREHLVFQRILALLNGISTLVLAGLFAGFVLDVIQLNSVVPAEGIQAFRSAAFKACFKYVTTIVVIATLTFAGWRISSWKSVQRQPRS